MLNRILKTIACVGIAAIIFGCTTDSELKHYKDYISKDSFLIDYTNNSYQTVRLKDKILNAKTQGLTIVQLGDSHTAADVMTMYLRNRLREYLGTGALGFIDPINVPGQYNSLIGYTKKNVSLINSRTQKNYDYALGGIIASFNSKGSIEYRGINGNNIPLSDLNLITRCTGTRTCTVTISSNLGTSTLSINSSSWRNYSIFVEGNFRISANNNLEIGGLFINNESNGVTVSSLGSNGATIYHLNTWNPNWLNELAALKPDLVILAYGTNESYNASYDSKTYIADYSKLIQNIRNKTQAQVMILSNPDSLNLNINKSLVNSTCDAQQHQGVDIVYRDLLTIAKKNNTLFWDWRHAMGGKCSAQKMMQEQLMRNDGVHFSAKGYSLFGYQLAKDIVSLANK
ncbi:GDSL-type esterase/lipase family protein [Psittacicella gerlachiana]|uniref:Uncharacterized protein n=1 Tax=Psittacicella gerlachiana TaxID=2028574 RepID=A0A3A1Y8J1_9GAMM|nr:GDSL-type esterase/lipase family protein [Psittacicella gerlachiana]RIY34623.1 hypothetical protein CKF59_05225 [Psittacicella gerlachiana]